MTKPTGTSIFKKISRTVNGKTQDFSDLDYLELLGLTILKEEEEHNQINPRVPYHNNKYDMEVVTVAKCVANARKDGYKDKELNNYLESCLLY